ncbi:MAG: FAD-dependent oxidoreductase [Burkholderiaceae bacterium]|nr:FAD-dependent oxidoreductase [Burkholderiaceae bacterium]
MSIYQIKLKAKKQIATGTMSFSFEKPVGFIHKAGQFADFTLLNPPETDAEGNIRGFSLTSAPYETNLMIATRMRDTAFKRVLKDLPIGTELTMDAPYGSFTLHNNVAIPAVFLTGGIGVTPVRSIVMQALHDKPTREIFVFSSNKTPQDAAFTEDLSRPQSERPKYTYVSTVTDVPPSTKPATGETGFINQAMLSKYISDLTQPIYYISGPQGMVTALRTMLNDAGVDDDNIRTEEFSGY